ncbi:MAG: DUF523 domain-containing protein [Syntrophobacterales bacterium]|nr:MAG: DUF523 domain-containing protein [Syntrophobacterales bacterium]
MGGDGRDVLNGSAHVIDSKGRDVTPSFIRGASEIQAIADLFTIKRAIMKEGSPSCGVLYIKRKGKRAEGHGVSSALFAQNGIDVVSSERINEYLAKYNCDRK